MTTDDVIVLITLPRSKAHHIGKVKSARRERAMSMEDVGFYESKAAEYRGKARVESDPRRRAALVALARDYIQRAGRLDRELQSDWH